MKAAKTWITLTALHTTWTFLHLSFISHEIQRFSASPPLLKRITWTCIPEDQTRTGRSSRPALLLALVNRQQHCCTCIKPLQRFFDPIMNCRVRIVAISAAVFAKSLLKIHFSCKWHFTEKKSRKVCTLWQKSLTSYRRVVDSTHAVAKLVK